MNRSAGQSQAHSGDLLGFQSDTLIENARKLIIENDFEKGRELLKESKEKVGKCVCLQKAGVCFCANLGRKSNGTMLAVLFEKP